MWGLPGLPVIELFRHAIEGSPEGATDARQAIASPLIEEVLVPIAIPFGSDQGFFGARLVEAMFDRCRRTV